MKTRLFVKALVVLLAWFMPFESAYALVRPVIVVGTEAGDVAVINVSGTPLASANLNQTAIAQIDVVNIDQDGAPDVLVTHLNVLDKPTQCYSLPSLALKWQTSHPTTFALPGNESFGGRCWWGDFDGDGDLEIVIPFQPDAANATVVQVFSGRDGQRECVLAEKQNVAPVVYFDACDKKYKLIGERAPDAYTHYPRSYILSGCLFTQDWENTSVNTWKIGAIGSSLSGCGPRIWGGWYGRTLYVLDRTGAEQWHKSFGGTYEAEAVYAGDLRGDSVEVLLVGGTYGENHVRLDAARLDDGTTLWTYDDDDAHWAIHVLAVEDTDGDNIKEVFAMTGGNASHPPKYLAINGSTGQKIWEQTYANSAWMLAHARFVDVNADGLREILVVVGNAIEARHPLTGQLVATYPVAANVTAFEVASVPVPTHPADLDGDGDVDLQDFTLFQAAFNGPNRAARNSAPKVCAGPDLTVVGTRNYVILRGSVEDDNWPNPPGKLTVVWEKFSGPGTVTFTAPNAIETIAAFDAVGVYVLRLSASDSLATGEDTVTVTVKAGCDTLLFRETPDVGLHAALNRLWPSPDGRYLIFGAHDSAKIAQIFRIRLDGTGTPQKLTDSYFNDDPAYSPDGTKIVFSSSRDTGSGCSDLWIMDADGSNQQFLFHKNTTDRCPTFTPDGLRIVFLNYWPDEIGSIAYPPSPAPDFRSLVVAPPTVNRPDVSPDGQLIVYHTQSPSDYLDIWEMNIDGSNRRQLTSDPAPQGEASYSRDGNWILYQSTEGGETVPQIWMMDRNGQNRRQLTFDRWGHCLPRFLPDGHTIVYAAEGTGLDGRQIRKLRLCP